MLLWFKQIVHPTSLPMRTELLLVHTEEYLDAFLSGALSPEQVRRIGFHEVTHTPVLIKRTLWECAGKALDPLPGPLAFTVRQLSAEQHRRQGEGYQDEGMMLESLTEDGIRASPTLLGTSQHLSCTALQIPIVFDPRHWNAPRVWAMQSTRISKKPKKQPWPFSPAPLPALL